MSRSAERGGAGRSAGRLALAALAVAVAALAWRYGDPLLASGASLFASPATQVRESLAELGRVSMELGGGGRVALAEVRFADVAVQAARGRAEVIAMVEGRGTVDWRGQRIVLGYVGREAFALSRCAARRWCSEGPMLPALHAILTALQARAAAAGPGERIEAWQVRVERDRATAGEDLLVDGAAGVERRRELHQLRRIAGRWELFAP